MSNNEVFFNNKRVLDLRLKLAKVMGDKNEAAIVQLILSSNDYNEDDSVDDFYLSEAMNDN
jgi:type IV pilus assembly protein PilF